MSLMVVTALAWNDTWNTIDFGRIIVSLPSAVDVSSF